MHKLLGGWGSLVLRFNAFLRSKLFCKKNNKQAWKCLCNLHCTIPLKCTDILQPQLFFLLCRFLFMFFGSFCKLRKTSSNDTCLGEPPGVFLWCCLLLLFYLTGGLSSFIAFGRHLSFFRELSPGFYAHFILSAQLIAEWFAILSFNLSRLLRHSLTASATILSGCFLPTGVFYLALLPNILAHFVTPMRAGTPRPGSSSVPAFTKFSFPADALSWIPVRL